MEKTKIFVSTPRGYVADDVKEIIESKFGESYKLVDSHKQAEVCVFADDWNENNICIEHHLYCESHKITIWEI